MLEEISREAHVKPEALYQLLQFFLAFHKGLKFQSKFHVIPKSHSYSLHVVYLHFD